MLLPAVPPIGSGASGDSGSMRYESEHKRDREKERERDTAASERVCMLTDKLTKLLDENKQLKQCIRGLDNRVTNTTSTAGVDPTSCKGMRKYCILDIQRFKRLPVPNC